MDPFTNKPTLIVTVGLPRSGKSTWAKSRPYPIVSTDAIRLATYGRRWWAPGEKPVMAMAYQTVRFLFFAGHERVILDSTNVTQQQRQFWRAMEDLPWELRFKLFDTPVAECHIRAMETDQADLLPIIDRMAASFQPLELSELPWLND